MMWERPIAEELEKLAHSLDLVLLRIDGIKEISPGKDVTALIQEKTKAGLSPEREKLLNEIFNQAINCDKLMQQELNFQRNRSPT